MSLLYECVPTLICPWHTDDGYCRSITCNLNKMSLFVGREEYPVKMLESHLAIKLGKILKSKIHDLVQISAHDSDIVWWYI